MILWAHGLMFTAELNGQTERADMISLKVNRTGCAVAFSSLVDRDAFARRVAQTRLRARWGDQMCCSLPASATHKLLLMLSHDGSVSLTIVVADGTDTGIGAGSRSSTQSEQVNQLPLW